MRFVGFVYFEGRLLAMEESGDVWELDMHAHGGIPTWKFLSHSPFYRRDEP
jgi:hypothetical protein